MQKSRRILFCCSRNHFESFDYRQTYDEMQLSLYKNSGNSLFNFAMQKMMQAAGTTVDIDLDFWLNQQAFAKKVDWINQNYDAVVICVASMLNISGAKNYMPWMSDLIEKIKIPFHMMGMGIQAEMDYSLDFVQDMKKEGYRFIKAVLKTGGKIGLRGYFSAETVKKLGFTESDYVVTGCPSLFMNGRGLRINKSELRHDELVPALNGGAVWGDGHIHKYFEKYPRSIFVAQDGLYRLLFDEKGIVKAEPKLFQDGIFLKLFKEKRVKFYADYPVWAEDLKAHGVNFSVGSRIHGNAASILAGIPSLVLIWDARLRELCEFFEIPGRKLKGAYPDLYEAYQNLDYCGFNKSFDAKYDAFKKFMDDCNLPCFEDKAYVDEKVGQLKFEEPQYGVSVSEVKKYSRKYLSKKRRFWYQFWHLYWLRGKKK